MEADSPDVVIAKQLLDDLKVRGFKFRRIAPGDDGPLVGNRVIGHWADLIHIEGFSRDCLAYRTRISVLHAPGRGLLERQVNGSALNVLSEVLSWEVGS